MAKDIKLIPRVESVKHDETRQVRELPTGSAVAVLASDPEISDAVQVHHVVEDGLPQAPGNEVVNLPAH